MPVKEVAEACQRHMTLVRTAESKKTKTCRRCGALAFVKYACSNGSRGSDQRWAGGVSRLPEIIRKGKQRRQALLHAPDVWRVAK